MSKIKFELLKIEEDYYIDKYTSTKKDINDRLELILNYPINISNLEQHDMFISYIEEIEDNIILVLKGNKKDLIKLLPKLFAKPINNKHKLKESLALGLSFHFNITFEEALKNITFNLDNSIKISDIDNLELKEGSRKEFNKDNINKNKIILKRIKEKQKEKSKIINSLNKSSNLDKLQKSLKK